MTEHKIASIRSNFFDLLTIIFIITDYYLIIVPAGLIQPDYR